MPQYPFPPPGPGAEEPPGSAPLPGHGSGSDDGSGPAGSSASPEGPEGGWGEVPPGGPEQGLFICLPAENMELSRFAGDDGHPAMAPGPLLAGVASAVAGGDGSGLAGVSEDFLFAVISGGRRMASWGTWLELAAMHELAVRHPATQDRTARQKRAAQDQPVVPKPVGAAQDAPGRLHDPLCPPVSVKLSGPAEGRAPAR